MYHSKESKIVLPGQEISAKSPSKDSLILNESPQQTLVILHKKLREEISKNSTNKIVYKDSKLNFKSQQYSADLTPKLVARSSSPTIGLSQQQACSTKQTHSKSPSDRLSEAIRDLRQHYRSGSASTPTESNVSNNNNDTDNLNDDNHKTQLKLSEENNSQAIKHITDGTSDGHVKQTDCSCCLIKELNQNLMNMYKNVQKQNEQMSRLRDKCLRSYFVDKLPPS